MRKLLMFLSFLFLSITLLLVGCSKDKIHESINDSVAIDARQVMNIVLINIEADIDYESMDKKDKRTLDSFYDKYRDFDDCLKCSDNDEDILLFALGSIARYMMGSYLESDIEHIKKSNGYIEKIITTGKYTED